MKFVDRFEELQFLEKLYEQKGFQFVPVYGRRRIGKTRLVEELIRKKPAIYFLADTLPDTEQLKNLGRAVGEYFGDNLLVDAGFRDWYRFFAYLKEKSQGRLALIIDEFPHLVNSNPSISSIFQKGIDQYLRDTEIFLILMGSSIGMMEKEVLFYKAPLYGRRTASLEVREMNFSEIREFFPEKNFEEQAGLFSIFGAIPAYLEKIDPGKDLLTNVENLILNRGTFLYNEVEFILREELREPRNYFTILRAIAQGKKKMAEIINDTGFEKSLISRYIDILRELKLVEKELPVTEKIPEKSRQGLYRIHDRFFSFWFKYVFPNRMRIEIGRADYVMRLIRDSLDSHISTVYEDICRDLCRKMLAEGKLSYTLIGRWWSKEHEIDIVALDEEAKTVIFGECKWSKSPAGEDIYDGLVRKSQHVDWHRDKRKERYILFSRSGFTRRMRQIAARERVMLVQQEEIVSE